MSALLATWWLCVCSLASAHEVRPCLLRITEQLDGTLDVLWKQPVNGDVAVHLVPHLSSGLLEQAASISSTSPTFAIRIWKNLPTRTAPLRGQVLSVEGLERTITDVLVSVTLRDGRGFQHVLTPARRSLALNITGQQTPLASGYLRLGIEHILTGVDHLLFVLGLLLLVGASWALLRTITAFTLAHSITLAASALGLIHVRTSIVESLVALSIVVLAVELVHKVQGKTGLTTRYPWLIAFAFGLLHGCAFAGALAETGLPQNDVPLALLLFNVGVEIGQLLFIGAALLTMHLVSRLAAAPRWARLAVPYAMGAFSAHWFIDRLISGISGASLT